MDTRTLNTREFEYSSVYCCTNCTQTGPDLGGEPGFLPRKSLSGRAKLSSNKWIYYVFIYYTTSIITN